MISRHGVVTNCVRVVVAGATADPPLDEIGITPLFVAASLGSVPSVSLLLARGADLGVRNWNGVTAFAMAAMRGVPREVGG